MGDLIMCITSGGQKMVGEDYSVPPHHMKPKSAPKYRTVIVFTQAESLWMLQPEV